MLTIRELRWVLPRNLTPEEAGQIATGLLKSWQLPDRGEVLETIIKNGKDIQHLFHDQIGKELKNPFEDRWNYKL